MNNVFRSLGHYRDEVEQILDGISEIKPKIHKMRLSCLAYYKELAECLPDFRIVDADHHMPGYELMGRFKLKGDRYKLYFYGEPYCPYSMFDVVEPSPASLVRLDKWMDSPVTVSSAEYAIDFICKGHQEVQRLLWLLRRTLYFPWRTGDIVSLGGPIVSVKTDGDENSLVRFWNRPNKHTGKSSNAVKLYERGEDKDIDPLGLGKPYWLMADVDRVRLEFLFSFKRHRAKFQKYLLRDLSGFSLCPSMSEVLDGQFKFAAFKGGKGLPEEWMEYTERDATGVPGCFHQERSIAKGKVKNISQHTVDSVVMGPLMKQIREALIAHDINWAQEAKRARKVRAFKNFSRCFASKSAQKIWRGTMAPLPFSS